MDLPNDMEETNMTAHNDENYHNKIRDYLIDRAHAVRVDVNRNMPKLSVLSEDFYAEFLNILLDLQLENENVNKRNVKGIDLLDWKNQVAVQVSATCAPDSIREKIRRSIRNYEKPEDEEWQFYYVPITDEAPELKSDFLMPEGLRFNRKQGVLDITRIMALASGKHKLMQLSQLVDHYSKAEKYRDHYKQRFSCVSDTSDLPYIRIEPLFDIADRFIEYTWKDKALKVFSKWFENQSPSGKAKEDPLSEERRAPVISAKEKIVPVLYLKEMLKDRRKKFIHCIRESEELNSNEEVQKKITKCIEEIKKISFGSCLFLTGRYGIGKTRFLKNLIRQSTRQNWYFCYLDLLNTNGTINEEVIFDSIKKQFGASDGDIISFIYNFFDTLNEDERIIFAIDNLDYAFQRGLRFEVLKELLESLTICDRIKWVFTIQTEQRYLALDSIEFAKEYGFVSVDNQYKDYFQGYDLNLDILSEDVKIFEAILREAKNVGNQSEDEIRLRQNHKYDAYLNPYVAELLIRLNWSWEMITKVEHLAYLELCQNYKERLLKNISDNYAIPNQGMKAANLCIDIGAKQIETGKNYWLEEDLSYENDQMIPLRGVGVISSSPQQDSDGHYLLQYTAADFLFWAEQVAELLSRRCKVLEFSEKINQCASDEKPISKLPYYFDIQRLFFLLLLQEYDCFDERDSVSISNGILPKEIQCLFSPEVYPRVSESLSFASKEQQQKMFFDASIVFLQRQKKTNNEADSYMYYSTFFEFCSTIQLSGADWSKLILVFPKKLSETLLQRTIEDFSALMKRKTSELSAEILSDLLVHLGNIDAVISDCLAERVASIYCKLYPDPQQLIKQLLSDEGLRGIRKQPTVSGNNSNPAEMPAWKVSKKTYPYCLFENTISKICDRIISDMGVLQGHELFWSNDWYAKDMDRNISFFVETRRKALNLSLTNYARHNGMEELEDLIDHCLKFQGKNKTEQTDSKEEALFLCRNSVLSEERSPFAFTDTIYNFLIDFIKDDSMKSFMSQKNVRQFYARHNLFALFHNCVILLKTKNEEKAFVYNVIGFSRGSITVQRMKKASGITDQSAEEVISWEMVDWIIEIPIFPRVFHKMSVSDQNLRRALYKAYDERCFCCGKPISTVREMNVVYIFPPHPERNKELTSLSNYFDYLKRSGFDTFHPEYVENYLPAHAFCYKEKIKNNNTLFIRHEKAIKKAPRVLQFMREFRRP